MCDFEITQRLAHSRLAHSVTVDEPPYMSQRANVVIARLHDGGHMIIEREKLINRDAKNTYGLV